MVYVKNVAFSTSPNLVTVVFAQKSYPVILYMIKYEFSLTFLNHFY